MTVSAGKKTLKLNLEVLNSRTTDRTFCYNLPGMCAILTTFHLLKTEGVNWRAAESTSKKTSKMAGIYQNLDFDIT